jgi:predicted DNA-binding protein
MSKDKITISFSLPVRVKEMLQELAELTYSTKTKVIIDMIRKDYDYWINNKKEEKVNE